MKKFGIYAICWAILLAVFNVICFATPGEAAGMTKFGGAFWAGYVFITLAFVGQLACAYFALKEENKQKLFYNLPLITVNYTGLILTIVFGALCMAIPDLPNWVGILICLVIFVFTAIAVIKAGAADEIVANVDEKIKTQTAFMKTLTTDAQNLVNRADTPMLKDICKKVYEALRYSDPMSTPELSDVERRIKEGFDALTDAVLADNLDEAETSAKELLQLITERNNICKNQKG